MRIASEPPSPPKSGITKYRIIFKVGIWQIWWWHLHLWVKSSWSSYLTICLFQASQHCSTNHYSQSFQAYNVPKCVRPSVLQPYQLDWTAKNSEKLGWSRIVSVDVSKSFGWSQLEVNPNDSCKLLSSLQQKIHIGCFETFVIVSGQPIAWFPNQSLVLWLFFKTGHGTRNTGFLRYDYFKCSPALSPSPTWGHLGWIQMVHLAVMFALVRIISSTPAFASPLVWAV